MFSIRSAWIPFFAAAVGMFQFEIATLSAETPSLSTQLNVGLPDRALKELKRALNEEAQFVKVHAAEALLALNHGESVHEVFERERKLRGGQPKYRIGIWRVLARTTPHATERQRYLDQLRKVYFNPASSDRSQAVETLAKLHYEIPEVDRPQFEKLAREPITDETAFRRWLLAVSGTASDINLLTELLDHPSHAVRGNTAYALRYLRDNLSSEATGKLAKAAYGEPESKDRVYLISAAYVTAPEEDAKRFKEMLVKYAQTREPDAKYEVTTALATLDDEGDFPLLANLLNDPDPDVRVGAANAILKISSQAVSEGSSDAR